MKKNKNENVTRFGGEYKLAHDRSVATRQLLLSIEKIRPNDLQELWEASQLPINNRESFSIEGLLTSIPTIFMFPQVACQWIEKRGLTLADDVVLETVLHGRDPDVHLNIPGFPAQMKLNDLIKRCCCEISSESSTVFLQKTFGEMFRQCLSQLADAVYNDVKSQYVSFFLLGDLTRTLFYWATLPKKPETLSWNREPFKLFNGFVWNSEWDEECADIARSILSPQAADCLGLAPKQVASSPPLPSLVLNSRGSAMQLMINDFVKQAEEALNAAEDALLNCPFPIERGSRKWTSHHFDWLVSYRLGSKSDSDIANATVLSGAPAGASAASGESYSAIAKAAGRERQTVKDGCFDAATLLFGDRAQEWLEQGGKQQKKIKK